MSRRRLLPAPGSSHSSVHPESPVDEDFEKELGELEEDLEDRKTLTKGIKSISFIKVSDIKERKLFLIPHPITKKNGKNLILDLDQTLIYTTDDSSKIDKLKIFDDSSNMSIKQRVYMIKIFSDKRSKEINMGGFERDDLQEFLSFIYDNFSFIGVWTAAEDDYGKQICHSIFRNIPIPVVIWSRKMCEREDGGYIKPLSKMIVMNKQYGLTMKNTLIIDDTEETFVKNRENALKIPAYRPDLDLKTLSTKDTCLKKIMNYFSSQKFIDSQDVRMLNSRKLF